MKKNSIILTQTIVLLFILKSTSILASDELALKLIHIPDAANIFCTTEENFESYSVLQIKSKERLHVTHDNGDALGQYYLDHGALNITFSETATHFLCAETRTTDSSGLWIDWLGTSPEKKLQVNKYTQQSLVISSGSGSPLLLTPKASQHPGVDGLVFSACLHLAGYQWEDINKLWYENALNTDIYNHVIDLAQIHISSERFSALKTLESTHFQTIPLLFANEPLCHTLSSIVSWVKQQPLACKEMTAEDWYHLFQRLCHSPPSDNIIAQLNEWHVSPDSRHKKPSPAEKNTAEYDFSDIEEDDDDNDVPFLPLTQIKSVQLLSVAQTFRQSVESPLRSLCNRLFEQANPPMRVDIAPDHISFFPQQLTPAYRVLRYLAGSGEGKVFLCRKRYSDKKDGERVAIKCYNVGRVKKDSPDSSLGQAGLIQEHLHDDLIVRVLRHGFIDELYFQVLEHLPFSLEAVQTASDKLSDHHYKYIAWCLLSVLRTLHEKELAYRDLKPDNIRISREGVPKLIDLGGFRHFLFSRAKANGFEVISEPEDGFGGTPGYTPKDISDPFYHDRWGAAIVLLELRTGYNLTDLITHSANDIAFQKQLQAIQSGEGLDSIDCYETFLYSLFDWLEVTVDEKEIDMFANLFSRKGIYCEETFSILDNLEFMKMLTIMFSENRAH